jgi:Beta-lactamase class C and other penicillin binding proteins
MLLVTAALASVATTTPAQAPNPATHPLAPRAIHEILAATSADSATRTAVVARWLTPAAFSAQGAATARLLGRLHEQGGALDTVRVETQGTHTLVTVRASRVPRLALLNLTWDRADSTHLRLIEVLKSWNPRADSLTWPTTKLSEAALVAAVDRNVRELARLGAFSGTVRIGKNGRTVMAKGYGWANQDDSIANGSDTRFMTASMGKMYTAVAIGQLIEAGRLHLDDTLGKVLPDYPNADRARRITIRQLLGHRAGLGDIWSHPAFRGRSWTSNRDLAAGIATGPLQFDPGTRWSYSNEGYIVLGAVIEAVTGQTYESYVHDHVWIPAGMTETAIAGTDVVVPHRAVGYQAGSDDVLHVEPLQPNWSFLGKTSKAAGAGGEYSSSGDLVRFAEALRTDKLLSRAMRDTLWAGGSALPWDAAASYALGFERKTVSGRTMIGHGGGGAAGIDNLMRFFPNEGWTVVVLSNIDPPAANDLATRIATLLATQ